MPADSDLRSRALAVLRGNDRGGYTIPSAGLYPYQWCWDSAPIALGWAAAGEWDRAWSELDRLLSAQWVSGMVPHIVFWAPTDDYFPGPEVWGTRTGEHGPVTTGITQPPLPVTAVARLVADDPDRSRAWARGRALWPKLVAWLDWFARARRGPHGAVVAVHPWETGMDNSPSWDEPLRATPRATTGHLERRDVRTVSAAQRPSTDEYRHYLGIVAALRAANWDSERQGEDSPFAVEDPCTTAVAARAAADLAAVGDALDAPAEDRQRLVVHSARWCAALDELWSDELEWYLPFDVRAGRSVGPRTAVGVVADWADVDPVHLEQVHARIDAWRGELEHSVATTDPSDAAFDPVRYWRGPAWVIVNWMVADGLGRDGDDVRAGKLAADTLRLVERGGFCEYFDPRDGTGIGGLGFSWTAALTLAWLTDPSVPSRRPTDRDGRLSR